MNFREVERLPSLPFGKSGPKGSLRTFRGPQRPAMLHACKANGLMCSLLGCEVTRVDPQLTAITDQHVEVYCNYPKCWATTCHCGGWCRAEPPPLRVLEGARLEWNA